MFVRNFIFAYNLSISAEMNYGDEIHLLKKSFAHEPYDKRPRPYDDKNNEVYFITMDILQLITNKQTMHKKYLTYLTEDLRKIII